MKFVVRSGDIYGNLKSDVGYQDQVSIQIMRDTNLVSSDIYPWHQTTSVANTQPASIGSKVENELYQFLL